MIVQHVPNIYSNNITIILWYPFPRVIMFGQLRDERHIPNGEIYISKLVSMQKLIDLNLLWGGLTALHGQLGVLNGNGRLDLDFSSGVEGSTGEKHEMAQRYGYQEDFPGVRLFKGHHDM